MGPALYFCVRAQVYQSADALEAAQNTHAHTHTHTRAHTQVYQKQLIKSLATSADPHAEPAAAKVSTLRMPSPSLSSLRSFFLSVSLLPTLPACHCGGLCALNDVCTTSLQHTCNTSMQNRRRRRPRTSSRALSRRSRPRKRRCGRVERGVRGGLEQGVHVAVAGGTGGIGVYGGGWVDAPQVRYRA